MGSANFNRDEEVSADIAAVVESLAEVSSSIAEDLGIVTISVTNVSSSFSGSLSDFSGSVRDDLGDLSGSVAESILQSIGTHALNSTHLYAQERAAFDSGSYAFGGNNPLASLHDISDLSGSVSGSNASHAALTTHLTANERLGMPGGISATNPIDLQLNGWVRATYNFGIHGGNQGTISLTQVGTVPANAVIVGAALDIQTSLVGVGASGALQIETAQDLRATNAVAQWAKGRIGLVPAWNIGVNSKKTTVSRTVQFVISGGNLTAGKFDVWLQYFVASAATDA